MKITAEEIVAKINEQIADANEEGRKLLLRKEQAEAEGNQRRVEQCEKRIQDMMTEIHALEVLLFSIHIADKVKQE